MAIKVKNTEGRPVLFWTASSTDVIKDQLIVSSSGAYPAAAAHSGQTILGVTCEAQATTSGLVPFYGINGAVLEIDFLTTGTKTSFTAANLGTLYDMVVTAGGFLFLVGYDNDKAKAYVVVDAADLLLSC
jgi:hypothetical protein